MLEFVVQSKVIVVITIERQWVNIIYSIKLAVYNNVIGILKVYKVFVYKMWKSIGYIL